MVELLRALSVVPVTAGLVAGVLLIGEGAGAGWGVFLAALVPLGLIGIVVAYSRGRSAGYEVYGGVVVLTAAVVGGIWQERRDVETNFFLVGFIIMGGWALGSIVTGGLGLGIWRHVKRALGRG